ncbi:transglycosylase SLT domain-containing protein [Streptomyces sp. NPDC003077]|uniref:aggregation-promoting factor C-terminal-like domain-containing protein n=1 Tax=Streptomyces sp. NPDC003077 TaxID=3154443 RepID=UPI0033BF4695
MSRISVRGFAVASATAVTTVGAVVGVASGSEQPSVANTEAAGLTIADIPAGLQAQVQTASLTQQAEDQSAQADAAALKSAQESARKEAARTAQEKKDAADAKAKADKEKADKEKAEKEKKEREESTLVSRSTSRDSIGDLTAKASYTVAETQALARQIVPADQFQCFSNIVSHESGWNYRAVNPSSGAYGLMQALPGSKMSSAGADWRTNPATQIKWGLAYMSDSRYGSPCGAWAFWQANHWY